MHHSNIKRCSRFKISTTTRFFCNILLFATFILLSHISNLDCWVLQLHIQHKLNINQHTCYGYQSNTGVLQYFKVQLFSCICWHSIYIKSVAHLHARPFFPASLYISWYAARYTTFFQYPCAFIVQISLADYLHVCTADHLCYRRPFLAHIN